MSRAVLAGGLLALLVTTITPPARAADMAEPFAPTSYPDAEPEPQYEFGTGWYLRGDVSAADEDMITLSPNAFPPSFGSKQGWNYGIGGGAGYQFNNYFRADLTGDYLGTQTSKDDSPNFYGKLQVGRWDGLANGYLDLGTWFGLTPYIGAGVGFGGMRTNGSFTYNGGALAESRHGGLIGRTQNDLAWAAMAGVSYHISPNLLLDIGYRYLDLGSYAVPLTFGGYPVPNGGSKVDMTGHEVRVGLRYMIN